MDQQLATLHDCLVPPETDEGEETRITFRLTAATKAKLERVTARHGTTTAAFLRRCCETVCDELGDATKA